MLSPDISAHVSRDFSVTCTTSSPPPPPLSLLFLFISCEYALYFSTFFNSFKTFKTVSGRCSLTSHYDASYMNSKKVKVILAVTHLSPFDRLRFLKWIQVQKCMLIYLLCCLMLCVVFCVACTLICVCYFKTVIVEWTINCSWHWIFSLRRKGKYDRHRETPASKVTHCSYDGGQMCFFS